MIKQLRTNFFIEKAQIANALENLKFEFEEEVSEDSVLRYSEADFVSLDDSLQMFKWQLSYDTLGNVCAITYKGVEYDYNDFRALHSLAGCVREGSYVDFENAQNDGEVTRILFEDSCSYCAIEILSGYSYALKRAKETGGKTQDIAEALIFMSTNELVEIWNRFCKAHDIPDRKFFEILGIDTFNQKYQDVLPLDIIRKAGSGWEYICSAEYFSEKDDHISFMTEAEASNNILRYAFDIAGFCLKNKTDLDSAKLQSIVFD